MPANSATKRPFFSSRRALALTVVTALTSLASCGGDEGSATLLMQAEETITDGIAAGTGPEDIVDGWSVTFETYIVGVTNVRLAKSSGGAAHVDSTIHVVDLFAEPPQGSILTQLGGLSQGRYDRVSYETSAPTDTAIVDATISPADATRMQLEHCSFLLRGTITKPDGESCPPHVACRAATAIDFELCVPETVTFAECYAPDGFPGLAVAAGADTTAAFTIHGDHLFFNGFPGGSEIVMRRAQWLANADVDGNDLVTGEELKGITQPSGDLDLLLPPGDYNRSGSPITPVTDAFVYACAQIVTQGHFQGNGECTPIVN